IPGLPLVGLNFNLLVDAFRAVLPSLTEAARGSKGPVNLPIRPRQLAQTIVASATPIPGVAEWESGAGWVDGKRVIDYYASVSVGELFGWLGLASGPLGSAAAKNAFHREGLTILMETVKLTRPIYVWDVVHETFVRGPQLKTQRGGLDDLRGLV